jgi:hypothetical protein
MSHHYDGYDTECRWTPASVQQVASIRRAIELIECLDDADSLENQETLSGLRAALRDIRKNNKFKGEF